MRLTSLFDYNWFEKMRWFLSRSKRKMMKIGDWFWHFFVAVFAKAFILRGKHRATRLDILVREDVTSTVVSVPRT